MTAGGATYGNVWLDRGFAAGKSSSGPSMYKPPRSGTVLWWLRLVETIPGVGRFLTATDSRQDRRHLGLPSQAHCLMLADKFDYKFASDRFWLIQ